MPHRRASSRVTLPRLAGSIGPMSGRKAAQDEPGPGPAAGSAAGSLPSNHERNERWRGWMAAAQAGDGEAYQLLLTELLPFVRGIVRSRLADAAAAEDVTQEVLLSIHTARHTYRSERPLTPWVRAISRNAVVDWARRQGRRREVGIEGAEHAASPSIDPLAGRLSPGLERALRGLPEAQRDAVVYLKVEGLSVAEAAAKAGVTVGAMKLRAHRGYKALRNHLGEEP